MISSRPANDLAVDVKVEHAAFVSCANTQLTAPGENGGILKENANSEKTLETQQWKGLKALQGTAKANTFSIS